MGLFGGFRRSELAALRLSDLSLHPADGLHVRLRRSKTDQEGAGMVKPLPPADPAVLCPICAVLRWTQVAAAWDAGGRAAVMRTMRLAETPGHICGRQDLALPAGTAALLRGVHRSGTLRGPLSGHGVNEIIRRRASQAGLPPGRLAGIGGHSLRAEFVTEAYRAGATAEEIARQTGHKSLSVLAGYRREHAPLRGNAVARLTHPAGGPDTDGGDTAAGGG